MRSGNVGGGIEKIRPTHCRPVPPQRTTAGDGATVIAQTQDQLGHNHVAWKKVHWSVILDLAT